MNGFLVDFLWAASGPPVAAFVFRFMPWRRRERFTTDWGMVAGAWLIVALIFQDSGMASGAAASLIVALIVRWFNRGRRDRARKLIGDKSHRVRDTLTRRMREHTPRRVLRPARQGAPS